MSNNSPTHLIGFNAHHETAIPDRRLRKIPQSDPQEAVYQKIETIISWQGLVEAIEPFYPKLESAGRRLIGNERMLRIYFHQHWFKLSAPAAEVALCDSRAMRRFVGVNLGEEPAPDETTICKLRHFMERNNLSDRLFYLVNQYLQENGLKVNRGTIVNTSIITAPSSTKNHKKQRDPQMHQTKKGNQWYFGMRRISASIAAPN